MTNPEHISTIIPRVMAKFAVGDSVVNDGRAGEIINRVTAKFDGREWNHVRFKRPDTPDEWIVDSELTRGRNRK